MDGQRREPESQSAAVRLTQLLATLACVAWVVGVFRAVAVFRMNGGEISSAFLWTLVPLLSAVGAFIAARRRSVGPIWVLAGVCCAFVVLAAWSLGTFFAWSGLLLLCAAVAHTVAVRPRWRAVLIPAWFLMGATGLCALFLAYHNIAARWSGGRNIEGPLIVTGAWVFAGLVGLLVIERVARVNTL